MTNLEQLKEKIQKAVPEIKKLEMGCKFRLVNEHWKKKDNFICIVIGKDAWAVLGNEECTNSIKTLEYGKFEGFGDYVDEILGRPITLFDIKQCLIYYGHTTKEFCKIAELWKEPNSLDKQSNELKEKLYEYTKSKNG